MKSIITDKWILCPECKAKTRTQVLENTELKNFPLFCPKCKKESLIDAEGFTVRLIGCKSMQKKLPVASPVDEK